MVYDLIAKIRAESDPVYDLPAIDSDSRVAKPTVLQQPRRHFSSRAMMLRNFVAFAF